MRHYSFRSLLLILAPILSLGSSRSLFNQVSLILTQALQSSKFYDFYEYDENDSCHVIVQGEAAALKSHFQNLHEFYIGLGASRIVFTSNSSLKPFLVGRTLALFRYSNMCYHFVSVSLPPLTELEQWKAQSLQLTTLRPERVHFIFVGGFNYIREVFDHRSIDALNFKLGICIDNSKVLFHSPEFFLNADTGRITLLDERRSTYKTRFTRGHNLMAGGLKIEPFHIDSLQGESHTGMAHLFISEVSETFNLTYSVQIDLRPFNKRNGTWRGFIGDLIAGRLDVFCCLSIHPSRSEVIDFTSNIKIARMVFFTSHPKINLKWQAIFYPFDWLVWLCVSLSFALSIPLFYAHLQLKRSHDPIDVGSGDAIFLAITTPLGALLQESMRIPRRAFVLTTMFIFYSMVIGTCYNSNFISCLTFPDPEPVPRTFKELACVSTKYRIQLVGLKGGSSASFFATNTNPIITKIRDTLQYSQLVSPCMTDAAVKPKTVCIVWRYVGLPAMAVNTTVHPRWDALLESQDHATIGIVTAVMQKHSKHSTFWNYVINALRETGHYDEWEKRLESLLKKRGKEWMEKLKAQASPVAKVLTQNMADNVLNEVKPFKVGNIIVAIAAVIIGCFIAIIVFIGEFLRNKSTKIDINHRQLIMTTDFYLHQKSGG